MPYVPPGWTGKLLLIGEAFGGHEDKISGRPFTGPAGKLLRTLWRKAGYVDGDVALYNAVRCRPKDNATPKMAQIRACRPYVLQVLRDLHPRIVLGLGVSAARSLTNKGIGSITALRGRPLEIPWKAPESLQDETSQGTQGVDSHSPPSVAYVTYHPAVVLHGATHLASRIVEDLKRAGTPQKVKPGLGIPMGPKIGVDTEFAADKVLTVGIANDSNAIAFEEDIPNAGIPLEHAEYLVGHNLAEDVTRLAEAGLPVQNGWVTGRKCLDSLLLAKMYDENALSYKLEDLFTSIFSMEGWKDPTDSISKTDASLWPPELRKERCRMDAWAPIHLVNHFGPLLKDKWPLVVFTHKTAATLARMQLAGAAIDMPVFQNLEQTIWRDRQQCADRLIRYAGVLGVEGFSPTNDTHLRGLLYDKLGLPVTIKTSTGLRSVNKDALHHLLEQRSRNGAAPELRASSTILQLIIDYNRLDKLYRVSVLGVREAMGGEPPTTSMCGVEWHRGYLPFRIATLGARTGRRTSSSPNSQNWPEEAKQMVTSRWKNGQIINADYKKLEVVVLAWLSKDDKLLSYFTKGKGYVDVARELLGYNVKEGVPEYTAIKSIVLGVHYNLQSPNMAKHLSLLGIRFSRDDKAHLAETDRIRKLYLKSFRGVNRFIEHQEEIWLRQGYVDSITGRIRHLPVPDRGGKGYGRLLNQAINFPVQCLASDIMASALIDTEKALCDDIGFTIPDYFHALMQQRKCLTSGGIHGIIVPVSQIFNEVHDALVADIYPLRHKRHIGIIVETMRAVPSLKRLAPSFDTSILGVDVKAGAHWVSK